MAELIFLTCILLMMFVFFDKGEGTDTSDSSTTPPDIIRHKGNDDYLYNLHMRNEEIERRKAEQRGDTWNGW